LKNSHLHTLKIYNRNITDKAFENLTNLHKLYMYTCSNITNKAFENLTNLEELYISCNSLITNEAFKNLKNIDFIYIRDCDQITDEIIKYLIFNQSFTEQHLIENHSSEKCLKNKYYWKYYRSGLLITKTYHNYFKLIDNIYYFS